MAAFPGTLCTSLITASFRNCVADLKAKLSLDTAVLSKHHKRGQCLAFDPHVRQSSFPIRMIDTAEEFLIKRPMLKRYLATGKSLLKQYQRVVRVNHFRHRRLLAPDSCNRHRNSVPRARRYKRAARNSSICALADWSSIRTRE
jgi:hypothetical protein